MNQRIVIPVCSVVMTFLVLMLFAQGWTLPVWPVFLAWACFFHLGGEQRPAATARLELSCLLFGVLLAWLSALGLALMPVGPTLPGGMVGPLLIAVAVGIIVLASAWLLLTATSVCIYGYASVWAFLDVAGRFALGPLTTLSADHVLVALPCGFVAGIACGWINAICVRRLSRDAGAAALPEA